MNYDSLVKRLNKAIDKAQSRATSSNVHIVDIDTDIKNLSGLIIILADTTKQSTITAH